MADRDLFRDAMADYASRRLAAAEPADPSLPRQYDPAVAIVRNDTGEALEAFAVVGLDDPEFDFSDDDSIPSDWLDRPEVSAVVPEFLAHDGRFAITLEPAAEEGLVRCVLSGIVPCRVLVVEDEEAYTFADIRATSVASEALQALALLPSGTAQVLWREDGVGLKWALVRLGSSPGAVIVDYVLSEPLHGDSSATATLSWPTGLWDKIEVTAGLYAPPGMTTGTLPAQSVGTAFWDRFKRRWTALQGSCSLPASY